MIGEAKEFEFLANEIREVGDAEINGSAKTKLAYTIGTMIEVPRACIEAGQIGAVADFFSFGTNDLTQMTYGLSRDDSVKFLDDYMTRGIYKKDPFQELDPDGVGESDANRESSAVARATRRFKIGICGEHGGDPRASSYAIALDSITYPARRSVCRSRGWPLRRLR